MSSFETARRREIRRYRKELRGEKIDLLFLSHMHADHVNGLPELLAKDNGQAVVDTVVMPLVDDDERLIAFALSAAADPAAAADPFYRAVVADAVGTIAERFSPRQIILVNAGRRGREAGAPDFDPHSMPPFAADHPRGQEPSEWRLIGRGIVLKRKSVNKSAVFETDDNNVFTAGGYSAGEAWLLSPFIDPCISRCKSAFLRELSNTLGITANDLPCSSHQEDRLSRILTKNANIKTLSKAYAQIKKDLNLTSMSLLSAPVLAHPDIGRACVCSPTNCVRYATANDGRSGWLGTGDANLKRKQRRRAFLQHYKHHLHRIHTLTVPHHGAKGNFHIDIVRKVKPHLCVVAADRVRKNWRHPARDVVEAILSASRLRKVTADYATRVIEKGFVH